LSDFELLRGIGANQSQSMPCHKLPRRLRERSMPDHVGLDVIIFDLTANEDEE
jgi:hypothetical protein